MTVKACVTVIEYLRAGDRNSAGGSDPSFALWVGRGWESLTSRYLACHPP